MEKAGRQEMKQFIKDVRKISRGIHYPVASRSDLISGLGGPDTSVEWKGRNHKLGQAANVVPDTFFPIESEEDFVNKAANLELMAPDSELVVHDMGQESPAKDGQGEPPGNLEEGAPRKPGPALVVGQRHHR